MLKFPNQQLRICIGTANYYQDMRQKRSEVLAPFTDLMSATALWERKEKHKKDFHTMKKITSRETLLVYPYFLCPFKIHMDASDYWLRVVIGQNNRPIAFYG